MLIWWGVFISTASVFDASGRNWGYVTIISPILTMLILLFLSGMPSAEGSSLSKCVSRGAAACPHTLLHAV